MRTFIRVGLFLQLILCDIGCSATPAHPPLAPVRPVVDDFYGTKVTDPYRYMENLSDPQVQKWIKAQADYAGHVLHSIPGRDQLLSRIQELDAGAPYRISIVRRWPNGDLHYLKRMATENLDKLYFRDGKTGQERLLVDPEKMGEGQKQHVSLTFCIPSPNGKYVAYGIAAAGSEQTTLHILNSETGKDLPETIDRMEAEYTPPLWLEDGSGFVYGRRRKLPADGPPTEIYKQTRYLLHRLGTDPEKDPLLMAMNASSRVPLAEADFPSIVLTTGSRWAIGKIKHGDANELTLYAAPASSLTLPADQIPWQKICDAKDEVEDFAVHADEIYLLTANSAPRYRVIKTPLDKPDFKTAQTVVPASDVVVQSVSIGKDALYVGLLDAGLEKMARVPFSSSETRLEMIDLPTDEPSGFPIAIQPDVDGAFIGTAAWTRAGRIHAFDPTTRKLTDTGLRPRGKFDQVEGYEAEEVMVPSHDGVRIPLSILHKTGLKLDGSHPTFLVGYGSYGMRMDVYFDPVRIAWMERGGVIAFAHVRGGGEFGKEWHHAGRKATKPNTWKDFIACGEYLVQKGFTSPGKLAGQGTSAGGILIGRAITERPDLFAAAHVNVGVTDAIRMETTTNGVPNIPEFGTVKTKEEFDALVEMSAYGHVKDGTKYPAILITHGINDPRVEPWMSAKLTARLQAATASNKPVLFRVDYDAGHGVGSTKRQRQEMTADLWSFLLWQMGENPRR